MPLPLPRVLNATPLKRRRPQSSEECCSDDSCADLQLLATRPAKQHRIRPSSPLVNAALGLSGLSNLHIVRGAEARRSPVMARPTTTAFDFQCLQDDCLDQFHAAPHAGQPLQRRTKPGITQLGSGVFRHGPALAPSTSSDPAPAAHQRPCAASLDAACPRPRSAGRSSSSAPPEPLDSAFASFSQQSSQASSWGSSPLPPHQSSAAAPQRHSSPESGPSQAGVSAFYRAAQAPCPSHAHAQARPPLSRQQSASSDATTAALAPAPAPPRRQLVMDPAPAVTNVAGLPRSCCITRSASSMELGSSGVLGASPDGPFLDDQQAQQQADGAPRQGQAAQQLQPGRLVLRGRPAQAQASAPAAEAGGGPSELFCNEAAVRAAEAAAAARDGRRVEAAAQPGPQVEPPFVGWFSRCRWAPALPRPPPALPRPPPALDCGPPVFSRLCPLLRLLLHRSALRAAPRPHLGWLHSARPPTCRGCGSKTAHELVVAEVEVPCCPRCKKTMGCFATGDTDRVLKGLLQVHLSWLQAGF
jgi:hypothetical protein